MYKKRRIAVSFFKKKLALIISCLMAFQMCKPIPQYARDKGFVYLHEIDPTILVSLRYYSNENFVGKVIDGYKKSVVILTRQAAEALKKVQEEVKRNGYCLVVYDAYRPQQAVDCFKRWSNDYNDCTKKSYYYPRVPKNKLFELDYIAARSGHSRGSTIDLTIIKLDDVLHPAEEKNRTLCDGYTIKYLDDGTVDMGSSFDMFDTVSHSENDLIENIYKERRAYLKKVMENAGFKNYCNEWWHFTLCNEPFPADQDSSYFNFVVK
jgi:zinc D-Ala-D-Ala dipeptidase